MFVGGCEKTPAPKKEEATAPKEGAALSIGAVKVTEETGGGRMISIPITARPGTEVDIPDVRVLVYVYLRSPTGEIVVTTARIVPSWKAPPVDWKGEPTELLTATVPAVPAEEGTYFGYVVAIYLKDGLMDFRSEPASLVEKFPLPLK